MEVRSRRFSGFAWGVLAYTVLVILWGGFVRATGSGAGCGAHWPLCNGEVVPRAPSVATLIELSHRLSSGLLGFLILGLVVWAFRAFPKGSPVRKGAVLTGVFVVIEALIGAGLVLFEKVAYDASIGRAYWMAAHLTNTFVLLAVTTLTAYWASGGSAPRWRGSGRRGAALAAALGGTVLLGVSGAVTALGDTLAIHSGLDPAEHAFVATLVGLRIYHPLLACAVLLVVAWATWEARRSGRVAGRLGSVVFALFCGQMLLGLANVALRAPIALQIAHLLVTDLIWIGLVLTTTGALGVARRAGAPVAA